MRKTPPFGPGFPLRPCALASIRAEVLPAADSANARSNCGDDRDHVVILTLPSSNPLTGSKTGTAAQVARGDLEVQQNKEQSEIQKGELAWRPD